MMKRQIETRRDVYGVTHAFTEQGWLSLCRERASAYHEMDKQPGVITCIQCLGRLRILERGPTRTA